MRHDRADYSFDETEARTPTRRLAALSGWLFPLTCRKHESRSRDSNEQRRLTHGQRVLRVTPRQWTATSGLCLTCTGRA
jgi:hypothetical protein